VLFIPDKRYCFDHFIPESTIADILDAQGRKIHTLRSVIEHRAMVTHNEPARHWMADHGAPAMAVNAATIKLAHDEFEAARGTYIDVHAWQFTPMSFEANMGLLNSLGLIELRVDRLYPTMRWHNEFSAVLRH
jgi:hypothetical protein